MLLQETLITGMNCNRQLVSQKLQWTKQLFSAEQINRDN